MYLTYIHTVVGTYIDSRMEENSKLDETSQADVTTSCICPMCYLCCELRIEGVRFEREEPPHTTIATPLDKLGITLATNSRVKYLRIVYETFEQNRHL